MMRTPQIVRDHAIAWLQLIDVRGNWQAPPRWAYASGDRTPLPGRYRAPRRLT